MTVKKYLATSINSAAQGSSTSSDSSWASRQIDRFVAWATGAYRATRSFSLLRIIYAVGMLLFLIPSYGDRAYLWGFASTWLEPEIKRRGYPFFIEKMFPKDNTFVFDLSYWSLIVLVLLFLVGYKTRFVTPVMLLFWIGLQSNSMLVTNGGDTIFRITLSFLIFANLSKHWSVDAWLQKRRGHRKSYTQKHFPVPLWLGAGLHNTALMLCCYQIMLVYVNSGIFKLMGKEWLEGSALYYSLNLDAFQVVPLLSELAWQITPAVLVATWVSIYFQLLFPVLLLWKYTRYLSLVLLLGMHVGIGFFMGLWSFSLAMIALDMLFVRDSSWEKAGNWVRRTNPKAKQILRSEIGLPPVPRSIPPRPEQFANAGSSSTASE